MQEDPKSTDAQLQYFGTRINPLTFDGWLVEMSRVLATGRRRWLYGSHNLHSLYLLNNDRSLRRFYARCNDCYIDGTPVRLILKGFGVATTSDQRFSLMDHFLDLLQHAETEKWSVFYLGSKDSVIEIGRTLTREMFPELRIKFHHGYQPEESNVAHIINEWRPDILLVGMGMPLQERWIIKHIDSLEAGIIVQVGATLDYYTGAQAKPPLWMSRRGLAWLYRLWHNPVRLFHRYTVEPLLLIYPTLRQWYRYRK